MTLPERLLAVTGALRGARLPHAFGGAIALAYWTLEPRGTRDLDVNVFLPPEAADRVLETLGTLGVRHGADDVQAIARDGQVRLWWDETPIDLFFDYADVHTAAAAHVRTVPFHGADIPVLGPIELAIFKAMFDRTKDWADIEAMFAAVTLDVTAVRDGLAPMLAPDDPRFARLEDAVQRARDAAGRGG